MIHMIYMAAGNSRRFGENKLQMVWNGKKLYQHGLWKLIHVMEESTVLEHVSTMEAVEAKSEKGHCPFTLTVVTQYPDMVEEIQRLIESDRILANVRKRIQVVYNPDSKYGASHTIKAGLQAIPCKNEEDYYLFMVADQPLLSEDSIKRLLDAVGKEKKETCKSRFPKGNPTDVEQKAREQKAREQKAREQKSREQKSGEQKCCEQRLDEHIIGYSLRCHGRPGNPCVFPAALLPDLMALEGDKGGRAVLKKHDCIYVEIEEEKEFWDIDTVQDLSNVCKNTTFD